MKRTSPLALGPLLQQPARARYLNSDGAVRLNLVHQQRPTTDDGGCFHRASACLAARENLEPVTLRPVGEMARPGEGVLTQVGGE
jgi:hypothetical protein